MALLALGVAKMGEVSLARGVGCREAKRASRGGHYSCFPRVERASKLASGDCMNWDRCARPEWRFSFRVAGVYGAVMLLAGTLTATVLRRWTGRRDTAPASSER
ncbi:MAG TPA: hypothetical protein VFB39_17880 [Solirubrobacteraceae bacterium]|nr:hypothetical protein [Solirubrobacteraceae bacterium]